MTKRKKRPVGRPPTGKNTMIGIRWPPWLLAGIDKYGRDQMLERPMALRQIVTKFLLAEGILDAKAVRERFYPETERPRLGL